MSQFLSLAQAFSTCLLIEDESDPEDWRQGCNMWINMLEQVLGWICRPTEPLEVKRVSERLMVVRVIVGRTVLNLISVYAPQAGRHNTGERRILHYIGEDCVGDR